MASTLAEKEGLEKVFEIRRMNTMSLAEIEKMTTPERLRAMEALWDALCHEKAEPDSPEWHRDVLSQRRKRIESGEAKFFSIEEAKRILEE